MTKLKNVLTGVLCYVCLVSSAWAGGDLILLPIKVSDWLGLVAQTIHTNSSLIPVSAFLADPAIHLNHSTVISDLVFLDTHVKSLSLEDIKFYLREVPESVLIKMARTGGLDVGDPKLHAALARERSSLDLIPDELSLKARLKGATDEALIVIARTAASRLASSVSTPNGVTGPQMVRDVPEELKGEILAISDMVEDALHARFDLKGDIEKPNTSPTLQDLRKATLREEGQKIMADVNRVRAYLDESSPVAIASPQTPEAIQSLTLQNALGKSGFRPTDETAVFGINRSNGEVGVKYVAKNDMETIEVAETELKAGEFEEIHLGRVYRDSFTRPVVFLKNLRIHGSAENVLFLGQGYSSVGYLFPNGEVHLVSKKIDMGEGIVFYNADYPTTAARTDLINSVMGSEFFPTYIRATQGIGVLHSRGLGPSIWGVVQKGRGADLPDGMLGEFFSEYRRLLENGFAFIDSPEGAGIVRLNRSEFIDARNISVDPSRFTQDAVERVAKKWNAEVENVYGPEFEGSRENHEQGEREAFNRLARHNVPLSKYISDSSPIGLTRFFGRMLARISKTTKGTSAREPIADWLMEGQRTLEREVQNLDSSVFEARVREHNAKDENVDDPIDAKEAKKHMLEEARSIYHNLLFVDTMRINENFRVQELLESLVRDARDHAPLVARNILIRWALEGAKTQQIVNVLHDGNLEIRRTPSEDTVDLHH